MGDHASGTRGWPCRSRTTRRPRAGAVGWRELLHLGTCPSPLPNCKRGAIPPDRFKLRGPRRSWRGHADPEQIPFEFVDAELSLAFVRAGRVEIVDCLWRFRRIVSECRL